MLGEKALNFLRRYPTLYSAMQGAYRERKMQVKPVQTPFGFKLMGHDAMQEGSFEPVETQLVQELLKDVDVFVNIGANVGYYVCHALQVGKSVVAVEPLAQNFAFLLRNLEANGWDQVELYPVALGDRPTVTKIYGGGTAASLVEGWANSNASYNPRVPVLTLDAILSSRFSDERLLIMIDVEGFELQVLTGAIQQLQREPAPIWFVEIVADQHLPAGVPINPSLLPTFDVFWQNGYRAENISDLGRSISRSEVEAWSRGQDLPESCNFLFRRD